MIEADRFSDEYPMVKIAFGVKRAIKGHCVPLVIIIFIIILNQSRICFCLSFLKGPAYVA